uniref:Uncharacterized protein n=1 Tax=Pseudomonas fluorescens (strain SBW25) TaxID=216595 RepID=A0A0G4E659_PSEFS|nr:hypothetical protein PQBR55_0048 [Pseudomonas fluorescens SBW25]
MDMPSDGNQTSDQAGLPMQQRIIGNSPNTPLLPNFPVAISEYAVI